MHPLIFVLLLIPTGCCHSFDFIIATTEQIYRISIDHNFRPSVPQKIEILDIVNFTGLYYMGNASFVALKDTELIVASLSSSYTILNFGKPDKMVIDEIYRNVYFADNILKLIGSTPLNGLKNPDKSQFKLITDLLGTVIDITMDSTEGFIIWIERRSQFLILKCDPMGRNTSVLIFEGLQHPLIIEANTNEHRLYWYDSVKQTIERSGYDGNDRSVIFQSPDNIAGFKPITDNYLVYFVDKSISLLINSTLYQISVSNTSGQWKHIYVQDTIVAQDRCTEHQCDHFCFLRENRIACGCFDGYTLSLNGKNCFASQSYSTRELLIVLDGKICFAEVDIIIGKSRTFRCQEEFTNVTEIEVAADISLKIIFIRETGTSWTISETLAENWEESIIFESKIQIQGLYFDTEEKKIYYSVANTIKRSDFKESMDIIIDEYAVTSFSVDSLNRYIVWVNTENYYIQIASLNGENIERVLQSLDIFQVYMHPFSKRIFWITHGGIMSVQFDGQYMQVNRRLKDLVTTMNIYEGLLVWTSSTEGSTSDLCSADYSKENSTARCININGTISDCFIHDMFSTTLKDNCDVDNGGCKHKCVGGDKHRCYCNVGYEVQIDGKSCVVAEQKQQSFYVVEDTTNTVFAVDDSYANVKFIGKENDTIFDIDIDRHTGELFTSHFGYIKHFISPTSDLSWKMYRIQGKANTICYFSSMKVVFIASGTTDGAYQVYQLFLQNGTYADIFTGRWNPLDLLCIASQNSILIAENSERPIIKVHNLRNGTITNIPPQFQRGFLRLKLFETDNVFYCLELSSSKFYRVQFDWKSYTILSEKKRVSFEDFDLDGNYLYALGKYDRFVYKMSKTTGVLHSKIEFSPDIGKISLLVKISSLDEIEAYSAVTEDTDVQWIPIVISVLVSLIAIAIISWICYRKRRKLRYLGSRLARYLRNKPDIPMQNLSRVDSVLRPPT